jgi:hypothetical protein
MSTRQISCIKLTTYSVFIVFFLFAGCSKKQPSEQTANTETPTVQSTETFPVESGSSPDASSVVKETEMLPINELTNDKQYRATVTHWCKEFLYSGATEQELYQACKGCRMHYIAVAFLEMYPESEYKDEVSDLASQFELKKITERTEIGYDTLIKKYGFNRNMFLYRWENSSFAGFVVNGSRYNLSPQQHKSPETGFSFSLFEDSNIFYGPICYGNLQIMPESSFVAGDCAGTNFVSGMVKGLVFFKGSAIIYPKPKKD